MEQCLALFRPPPMGSPRLATTRELHLRLRFHATGHELKGMCHMINVAIINATQTSGLKDAQVQSCVAALQKQVSNDFAPVWGVDARLHFYSNSDAAAGKIPKDYWWLAILDDSD